MPEGFDLERVADGLSFSSAVALADDGTVFAAQSGFDGARALVAIVGRDRTQTPVVDAAAARPTPPITDIAFSPDGTLVTRLHSEPPLVLRPTNPIGPEPMRHCLQGGPPPARVSLVAGAAGPVGSDDLRLSIDVQSGAGLVLRNVAATLVLPGPHGRPSRTEMTVRVATDGVLV